MTERRLDRFFPLAGIAAVALWVIGFIVVEGGSDTGAETAAETLAVYQDDDAAILAGGFITMLGTVFFLWFLGSLRTALMAAEGVGSHLTAIAFAGGIVTAVCLLLVPGPNIAGAINNDELTAEAAQAMTVIDDAFFLGAELAAIVLVVATGLLALRTGVLPRWLAWFSFLIAVALVIVPIGWAALIFGLPVWVLAVSILLFTRGAQATTRGAPAPA